MLDEATQMQNSISCNIRIFIQHSPNIRTKMLDEMLDAFAPALKEVFQWTSEVNFDTAISIFEKINPVY